MAAPQMDAQNQQGSSGRKRHLMTFSEITDAFVDARVRADAQPHWGEGKREVPARGASALYGRAALRRLRVQC